MPLSEGGPHERGDEKGHLP